MKRFLAPLALTLGLVLVVVAAASLRSGPADHSPQTQVAPQPAGPAVADVQHPTSVAQAPAGGTALADSTAPAAQAQPAAQPEAQPAEQPAVKTGCGKAVPCPGRDCKDCPLNRYL
jgi:hypothetical protein